MEVLGMRTNFEINVLSHIDNDMIESCNAEDKKLLQEATYKNTLGNKNFVNVLKRLADE